MAAIEKENLWKSVLGELEVSISPAFYNSFIKPCYISSIDKIDKERLLVELGCMSGFHQQTIDQRYYAQIKQIIEKQTGKQAELALKVKPRPFEEEEVLDEKEEATKEPDLFEHQEFEEKEMEGKGRKAGLNLRFSFDNFVVGSSNQLAYAAAKGVVDAPGTKHNPLFLWGGVGVGKTHLMHAVGQELLGKGLNVQAATSEQFTNELVTTIRNKNVDEFKKKYRNLDVLLIDDIQFFAGKESSQEEFFHTFNELYSKGAQIVLTSDRRPQEIEDVEDRLISRFLGGLTVDISLPDWEMRLAILKQKCNELKVNYEPGALDIIATSTNTNARELEGILTRIINIAEMETGAVTKNLVEREIGVEAEKRARRLRPQEVISLVAKHFDLKNKQLVGKSRKSELVKARHITMYLLREEMGMTLQRIAKLIGDRDHTTVMHAVEKIEEEMIDNRLLRSDVMEMKQKIYK